MQLTKDHDKLPQLEQVQSIIDQYLNHTRLPGAKDNKEMMSYLSRMRMIGLLNDNEMNFYIKEKALDEPPKIDYEHHLKP